VTMEKENNGGLNNERRKRQGGGHRAEELSDVRRQKKNHIGAKVEERGIRAERTGKEKMVENSQSRSFRGVNKKNYFG